MKIELPETFSRPVASKASNQTTTVKLGFTGCVIIPDAWTGGDFEDLFIATEGKEGDDLTIWDRQWAWANERIVEWAIDGVPTNPNEIAKGEYLTWALQSFLAHTLIWAMNDYAGDVDEANDPPPP